MLNLKNNPRLKIFLLMLVFTFPILIGQILYSYKDHLPFKTLNHGILLKPPINAEALNLAPHEKLWKIIYIPKDKCDSVCEEIGNQLHNMQLALGKNSKRVVTLTILSPSPDVNKLQTELLQQDAKFDALNKIYLIDPLDNIFMYYPMPSNLMNIFKDLKKVLEVSQIG